MTNDLFDSQQSESGHDERHLSLETLSAYLDGELSADDRNAAKVHLSTCQVCRDELQSLRATTTLMRSLPDMRPAQSFQLGPEHAKQARGAVTSSWPTRILGLMPALRAATAAVALLLVVVVAGDVLTSQDNGNQKHQAVITDVTATAPTQIAAPTNAPAPTNTPADTLMIEAEAPTEPTSEADDAAPAGAAAAKESTEEGGPSQEDTEVSAMQAQESGAGESRAAEPQETSAPVEQPAAPAATAAMTPSSTPEPTATPQPPAKATPTSTPTPSDSSGTSEVRVSNWRIAEIALGLLLAWLIVTLIGASRLRRR